MLTKEQFLDLGWSDNLRRQFEMLLLEGNGKAFSANRLPDGSLRGRVWAEIPEDWDTDLVYVFGEPEPQPIAKPGPTAVSRTAQALQLIDEGWSAYKACKFVGLSQAAVSRARKRREGREDCPHCGQLMKA